MVLYKGVGGYVLRRKWGLGGVGVGLIKKIWKAGVI